mmetsp:Transcript_47904/g.126819  ORF Transcript_47904/g.126819 Transcript_47904/m.126819 type:complete len:285 (+) Transcript_47904:307-1161(+)
MVPVGLHVLCEPLQWKGPLHLTRPPVAASPVAESVESSSKRISVAVTCEVDDGGAIVSPGLEAARHEDEVVETTEALAVEHLDELVLRQLERQVTQSDARRCSVEWPPRSVRPLRSVAVLWQRRWDLCNLGCRLPRLLLEVNLAVDRVVIVSIPEIEINLCSRCLECAKIHLGIRAPPQRIDLHANVEPLDVVSLFAELDETIPLIANNGLWRYARPIGHTLSRNLLNPLFDNPFENSFHRYWRRTSPNDVLHGLRQAQERRSEFEVIFLVPSLDHSVENANLR